MKLFENQLCPVSRIQEGVWRKTHDQLCGQVQCGKGIWTEGRIIHKIWSDISFKLVGQIRYQAADQIEEQTRETFYASRKKSIVFN